MNQKEIESQYKQISDFLQNDRLLEAMTQLGACLQDSKMYRLSAKLDEVRTSYHYMLQYMSQGVADENRSHLFMRLKNMLWVLLEQTHLWQLDQVSDTYYHTQRKVLTNTTLNWLEAQIRLLEEFPDELAVCPLMPTQNQQQILKKHEQIARQLFINIWCNSGWMVEEHALLQRLLTSDSVLVADQCLMVSALTLSLLQCVDPLKLSLLAETCRHKDARIAQRALVGIALIAIISPNQVARHSDSLISLSSIFDQSIANRLNTIYIQLLRAQGTDKVDKKMREEIIPEMIKNMGQIHKFGAKLTETDEDEELNPQWQDEAQSKFEDKIREMGEMQQAGADVYLSTFAQLKSYPFFHELPNWFCPFDTNHSSIVSMFGFDNQGENKLLNLLLHSGMFCHSDKYSLCFTMNMMPPEGREQLFTQLTEQGMDVLEDEQRLLGLKHYVERPEFISNSYIQDLYRFFKLHPRRKEFKNPFLEKIVLHRLPFFEELNEPERMKQVADSLFQQENFEEFEQLYKQIITDFAHENADIINAAFYRRLGYAAQKQKHYAEAIQHYERADLMQPNHLWTIRRLATCCRLQEAYEKAIDYYQQIEEMQPENTPVLLQIAGCLANLKRYDEALSYLKKVDFLDADNLKTWRAIAWCYFLKGNYNQASNYCEKLLNAQPIAMDYLNAAHVAWLSGHINQASRYYRQTAQMCENRQQFLDLFNKDVMLLQAKGILPEEISLMKELTLLPQSN